MSKYHAKKVIVTEDGTLFEEALVKKYKLDIQGQRFDSKMEGEYYQELLRLVKDGIITNIEFQPVYVVQESPKIKYIADFKITFADGDQVVIDVKGVETAAFKIKRKLFENKFPMLKLQVITRYCGAWMSVEEVKKEKRAIKKATNKLLKIAEQRKGERIGRV